SKNPEVLVKAVCIHEPERPSTAVSRTDFTKLVRDGRSDNKAETVLQRGATERLKRSLRGDVDNIVLMAMRKEPMRRYQSVEHLSKDIKRHLEGLPVNARKAT